MNNKKSAILVIAAVLSCHVWIVRSSKTPRQLPVPPPLPIVDISTLDQLGQQDLEIVGDWRQDGHFRVMRGIHLVTFVSYANAQPDRHTPRLTDALEPEFYDRLVFGDRRDNERDKNHCHFRLRIRHPECLSYQLDSLLLHLRSGRDIKQLEFEWVNSSFVSRPFILVDELKEPRIRGLTELLTDSSFAYAVVSRRSTSPE